MKFQAAFNGAMGESLTLFAIEKNGILVIANKQPFNPNRKDSDFFLIANNPLVHDADSYFEDVEQGLIAYRALGKDKLILHHDLAQYKLENVVEQDGVKDNGRAQYRFQTLENGHLAILAICDAYVNHTQNTYGYDECMTMMNRLTHFFKTI
ncbi:MAG: hypothetical protein ACFNXU_00725 [Kingella sp. (in: b-proteobacteria)]